MKCIYCNSENDMTVSDIIPWAITGAKLRKQFVCRTHNAFTNDHFERKFIAAVGFFRNQLGLTERYGDPVRYTADLTIDGYTFENVSISDKASVVASNRLFSQANEYGEKTLVGDINQLLRINGATTEKIKPVDLSNIMVCKRFGPLDEIFISYEALHTVAKIGYEWHCYINNLDGYDDVKYKDIVDFILNPECTSMPVDLVVDAQAWSLMDQCSRMGSNMLYEYDDIDGNTYVVFGLWNVLIYRIKICSCDTSKIGNCTLHKVYLYNSDKSIQETAFGTMGNQSICVETPKVGFNRIIGILEEKLLKLEERSITSEYIRKNIDKIKKVLPGYEVGTCTFEKLMDYEENDRLLTIFILEKLWEKKAEYNKKQSFEANVHEIMKSGNCFIITEENQRGALERYVDANNNGTFADMLKQFIQFFEQMVPLTP